MSTTVSFDGSQPPRPVGHFTYAATQDRWSWSDGLYQMHGYAPREVPATTQVLLSHKHPDDRARAYAVLEQVISDGEPFSCYHRIIDSSERVRSVLSVGHGQRGPGGQVDLVEGFFVDLTDVREEETQAEVTTALARISVHRETIDLAKGILMLGLGCSAEEAFLTLRRYSQDANIKLHEVAHRLVEAVAAGSGGGREVLDLLDGLMGRGSEAAPA